MRLLADLWHVAPDERGVVRALYRGEPFHPFGSMTFILQPEAQRRD